MKNVVAACAVPASGAGAGSIGSASGARRCHQLDAGWRNGVTPDNTSWLRARVIAT